MTVRITKPAFNLREKLSELDKVDIVAYLVAHKEFIDFKTSALELDFCGVKKNNFEKFI